MARWKRLCVCSPFLLFTMLSLQAAGHIHAVCGTAVHHRRSHGVHQRARSMVFYMHDLPSATNPTAVQVAAQDGKLGPPFKLGATVVFDDKLTAGPDPNSLEVGRGQGLYAIASLTSLDLLLTFTAVLHRPAIYNGSTISLHGSDRVFLPTREISVVGGTGFFRFARGFAELSTVEADGLNAIIKFNLTLLLLD